MRDRCSDGSVSKKTFMPRPSNVEITKASFPLLSKTHGKLSGVIPNSSSRRAAGRSCCVSIIGGPSVIRKLARHMTFASIPPFFLRSKLQVVRGAAAPGCCGGVLEVRVGCTIFGAFSCGFSICNSLSSVLFRFGAFVRFRA